MGLNFRKSISLGKGLKLNLGTKSSSVSVGVPGARYSVNTKGKQRVTFGIPGTGLSYSKSLGSIGGDKKDKGGSGLSKREIRENEDAVREYEEQVGEVKGIHTDGADPIDWNKDSTIPSKLSSLKERVLKGDIDAYYEVIEKAEPFDAIVEWGSEFEIGTDSPDFMEVEFNIKADEVLPTSEIKQLSSGKLSEKELTKTSYYDIYQDYVCSVAIRVARDMFALLPVDKVLVHAMNVEVNTATGNEEEVTYLSVIFTRDVFEKINLNKIDPSDSLANFKTNVKFAKTTGFKPVERLNLL